MITVCQYSKLESFKNLKINVAQINLCLQDHMKQCRWEANGYSLLRGQQKKTFVAFQDSPCLWCLAGIEGDVYPKTRQFDRLDTALHQRLREAFCPPQKPPGWSVCLSVILMSSL